MPQCIIYRLKIINIEHKKVTFTLFILHKRIDFLLCSLAVQSTCKTINRGFFTKILFSGHLILNVRNLAQKCLWCTKTASYQTAHPSHPTIIIVLILKTDYKIINLIRIITNCGKKCLNLRHIIWMNHCEICVIIKRPDRTDFLQSK